MPRVSSAHQEQRRQQILAAAMACFARQGFHATSIGDIVQECCLSVGAIYQYFPSKEELFLAVVAVRMQQTLVALKALFARPGPMIDKTQEAADLFFAQLADELMPSVKVSMEFWREAQTSERVREQRIALCDGVREFFHWLLGEARRRGELRQDADVPAVTELLMALNDGILMHHATGIQPIPLPALRSAYVAFITHALVPPARPSRDEHPPVARSRATGTKPRASQPQRAALPASAASSQ